jgi:hypothetical protein
MAEARRQAQAACLACLAALGLAASAGAQQVASSPYATSGYTTSSTPSHTWSQDPAPTQRPQLLPTLATPVQAQPAQAKAQSLPESPASVAEINTIQPVRFQPPASGGRYGTPETKDYQIQLEPPGLERLSRLDSEESLFQRIRTETIDRDPNERVEFPEEPILSRDGYYGRGPIWPHRDCLAEPYYVEYKRLFFEDKNSERYGWDFGALQPFVSAGLFYLDLALLPYHMATDPCRCYESNTGYCLPGDATPYLIYPPEISLTGAVAETAVVLALVAIFP